MKTLLVVLGLLAAAPVLAQEGAPSAESLQKLFAVMHVDRVIDVMITQVDAGMQSGIREALKGESPNPKQQQIIDHMREQVTDLYRRTLNWQELEPTYLDVYRRNFTQRQVDDMLTFYQSPTGRAVIDKLPVVMQESAKAMLGRMPALIPQLKQIMQDTKEQLQAAEKK